MPQCDEKSPCSRCSRLNIPCVGAGERRYKFKYNTFAARNSTVDKTQTSMTTLGSIPDCQTMKLTGLFVSRLEIRDPRFNWQCYGPFLRYVPQRLGVNDALDASVESLTCAFTSLHTHQNSTNMLVKYGSALKKLRKCLNDPVKAQSPETLCAIYLILITEVCSPLQFNSFSLFNRATELDGETRGNTNIARRRAG